MKKINSDSGPRLQGGRWYWFKKESPKGHFNWAAKGQFKPDLSLITSTATPKTSSTWYNRDLKHRHETDDYDASQPRQTGLRVSFSAENTKFKQCSFPDRRRLFLCEEVCLICYSLVMAFKDLRNLHLISYDDGLIDGGKFIVLYDL